MLNNLLTYDDIYLTDPFGTKIIIKKMYLETIFDQNNKFSWK